MSNPMKVNQPWMPTALNKSTDPLMHTQPALTPAALFSLQSGPRCPATNFRLLPLRQLHCWQQACLQPRNLLLYRGRNVDSALPEGIEGVARIPQGIRSREVGRGIPKGLPRGHQQQAILLGLRLVVRMISHPLRQGTVPPMPRRYLVQGPVVEFLLQSKKGA